MGLQALLDSVAGLPEITASPVDEKPSQMIGCWSPMLVKDKTCRGGGVVGGGGGGGGREVGRCGGTGDMILLGSPGGTEPLAMVLTLRCGTGR